MVICSRWGWRCSDIFSASESALANLHPIGGLVSLQTLRQIAHMQTAERADFVSVQEYLDAEATSRVRHEYLGGLVYAMAGETLVHNLISQNLLFNIRRKTKGGPCRVFISDIRVNFHLNTDEYFYYPDIVVTCEKRDTHPRFVRHPKLIIEVLSESTERIDKREKFFAYTGIESLHEYVLVGQANREVVLFRRRNGWKAEKISGAKAALKLESIGIRIPFSAIYEGV
jgi:Uma2 family endonuclease